MNQRRLDYKIGLMKKFRPLFVPAIIAARPVGVLFSRQCGANWWTAVGAGVCVLMVALFYAALGYAMGRSD